MGMFELSSTTPVIVVFAGFPGTFPVAVKLAGPLGLPGKDACTMLLAVPAFGPSVKVAATRPSLSEFTMKVGAPAKLPPPAATVKVTGTLASRLLPESTTTAISGSGSGAFTAPICGSPVSTTIDRGPPCVPVAEKIAVPLNPALVASTLLEPAPARPTKRPEHLRLALRVGVDRQRSHRRRTRVDHAVVLRHPEHHRRIRGRSPRGCRSVAPLAARHRCADRAGLVVARNQPDLRVRRSRSGSP